MIKIGGKKLNQLRELIEARGELGNRSIGNALHSRTIYTWNSVRLLPMYIIFSKDFSARNEAFL